MPGRLRLTFLAAVGALALAALPAAPALGHGGEEEALAQTPARTLVQQALGLVTQAGQPAEAQERLHAALESEQQEGVALASVRRASTALEQGDEELAVRHMNEALAPAEAREEPQRQRPERERPAPEEEPGEEGGEPAPDGQAPPPSEEAFEQAGELEPESGTAEWVGFGLGVAAIALALALLARGRRAA